MATFAAHERARALVRRHILMQFRYSITLRAKASYSMLREKEEKEGMLFFMLVGRGRVGGGCLYS